MKSLTNIADKILKAMLKPHDTWNDELFDELALQLFTAQRESVEAYAKWCNYELLGKSEPSSWREIPALPINAFKQLHVASSLPSVATWYSSGTTSEKRSEHHLANTAHYDTSLDYGVYKALLPDVAAGEVDPLICIQLQPSAQQGVANSSLTHMYDRIRLSSLCIDGGTYVDSSYNVQAEAAWDALSKACTSDTPVLLLTTSFALAILLEKAADEGWEPLKLPPKSRVVDTGGYKGKTRELSRAELLEQINTWLGVSAEWCENEYGMSELSSQAWLGTVARSTGHSLDMSPRWLPPWLRVRVVNPDTLDEVAESEQGLLVFHDLANVWSCACIRSEDIAIRYGNSFELIGRAPDAALKGCSLRLEGVV